jgi:uncharacterized membrane protein YccF (DUF307 family)
MMRAFFISTCVLTLIYIISAFVITTVVDEARTMSWLSYDYDDYSYDYDYSSDYGYDSYDSEYYDEQAENGTRLGGIVSVLYMLLSGAAFLLALMKIKTKTMKVISIIGLSLSGLFLLWGMLPVASPGSISFDEIGGAFALAGVALLGLHIVGMVHAFKTST